LSNIPVEHKHAYQQFYIGPVAIIYNRDCINIDHEIKKTEEEEEDDNQIEEEIVQDLEENSDSDESEGEYALISDNDFYYAMVQSASAQGDYLDILYDLLQEKQKLKALQDLENARMETIMDNKKGNIVVRVDFIGKPQICPVDNQYYTTIEFLDISGTGFTL